MSTTPQGMLFDVYYSCNRLSERVGQIDEKITKLCEDFERMENSLNRLLVLLEREK